MRAEVALAAGATLGEGPTWDAAHRRLIWVDILASRVHTLDPSDGRRTVLYTGQHVGAAKPRERGGLVVNLRDGVGLYEPTGAFSWLVRDAVPGRRGNDAAVAPDGALWAGTMRYDERAGGGNLTRIGADGTAVQALCGVAVSNGTGWSPDGRRMYYVDSPTRRVDVFDVTGAASVSDVPGAAGTSETSDAAGPSAGGACGLRNRRPLTEVEPGAGFPDGLCVDAEGCVWVALWDGGALRRYAPDGRLDRTVRLPVRRPTACAFGGRESTDLYVTTASAGLSGASAGSLDGALLVLPGIGRGLPGTPFAG